MKLTILCGNVDVEVKAVLALVLYIRRSCIQVVGEPYGKHDLWQHPVDVLRAHWCKLGSVTDLLPRAWCLRGLEAPLAHWRGGIGDAQVLLDRAQNLIVQLLAYAPKLPVACGDHRVLGGGEVCPLAGGQCQAQRQAQQPHQASVRYAARAGAGRLPPQSYHAHQ